MSANAYRVMDESGTLLDLPANAYRSPLDGLTYWTRADGSKARTKLAQSSPSFPPIRH